MNEKIEKEFHNDEIDLYELYSIIKKHLKFILSFVFLVTILAIASTFFMKPVYKSDISLFVSQIDYSQIKPIIDELKLLKKDKDLAQKLNVDIDSVKAIENIDIQKDKDSDKVFYISLYVYDKNKIPLLADAILRYINQNPIIKSSFEERLKQIDTYINNAQKDVTELETLKNKIFNDINNGKVSLLGVNPVEIDKSLIDLKSQIESLNIEKQTLQKGITFLTEPVIPENKYKPKRSLIAAISFISSLFMAIFIVLLKEWIDKNKSNLS